MHITASVPRAYDNPHPPHSGSMYALWKNVFDKCSPWMATYLQPLPQNRHIRLHGIAYSADDWQFRQ